MLRSKKLFKTSSKIVVEINFHYHNNNWKNNKYVRLFHLNDLNENLSYTLQCTKNFSNIFLLPTVLTKIIVLSEQRQRKQKLNKQKNSVCINTFIGVLIFITIFKQRYFLDFKHLKNLTKQFIHFTLLIQTSPFNLSVFWY